MNQLEQLKELAKQAYNSSDVCQEWKNKITKILPELKRQLEKGVWYKVKDFGEFMFCFNGEYGDKNQYGFDFNGRWSTKLSVYETDEYIKCTKEEIQSALIKEAKRRGFKEGVEFRSVWSDNVNEANNNFDYHFHYEDYLKNVLFCNNNIVFLKGEWAEIIDQPKERYILEDGVKYKLVKVEE